MMIFQIDMVYYMCHDINSLLIISGLTVLTISTRGKTPSYIIFRVKILFAKTFSEQNLFKCLSAVNLRPK